VLFGAEVRVDREFLARLDTEVVRRRFRKRAVEVHPDRAAVLRRHPAALAEAFKQVEQAYRTVRAHLDAGQQAKGSSGATAARPPSASPAQPVRPARQSTSAATSAAGRSPPSPGPGSGAALVDHYWSGPIPSRTLRLGEFLYYSGHISWLELIRGLVWQARQRPRFGQVANRFGYLTLDGIAAILAQRQGEERIGEAALRLCFLTNLQQQVVLHAQQRGCRRIGDYFVEAGLLASPDLERFGRSARAHNARVALAR
jgi:hypothetical protein